MERLTNPEQWFNALPVEEDIGNVSPDNYLKEARRVLPEKLCVKDVYASLVILENSKPIITAYSRNVLPDSTPRQLEAFSPDNLKKIAAENGFPDHTRPFINFFRSLEEDGRNIDVANCLALAKQAGVAWCFNGISIDGVGQKANKRLNTCPNSLAGGCAERTLLYWLPYLIYAHKKLDKNIVVNRIKFDEEGFAYLYIDEVDKPFVINPDELELSNNLNLHESYRDLKLKLITSYLPCPDCAKAISELRKEADISVIVEQFSRHKANGDNKRIIDDDDAASIETMQEARVPIYRMKETKPPLFPG